MKQTNAMKNLIGSIISDKDITKEKKVETPTVTEEPKTVKPKSRQKSTDNLEASGERVIKTTYSIRQSTHKKVRLLSTLMGQNLPEIIDEALSQYIEKQVSKNPDFKAVLDIK